MQPTRDQVQTPAKVTSPPTVNVIGFPLAVTDYQGALEWAQTACRGPRPASVALCPTQVVTDARLRPEAGDALRRIDLLLPDGMPVVWLMRAQGAPMRDRVYGPYLMKYVVERTPAPYRHFLFGGSEACLAELQVALRRLQPGIEIAGVLSPPYRAWTEADQQDFVRVIDAARPDFIWVALGGGKQEPWIANNAHRYQRGVFLAVGDAFELLAGRRTFAPAWMQKFGLTWLYRLVQEPRRLWKRYLVHNTAYLAYALAQMVRYWTGTLPPLPDRTAPPATR